jgi:uncharacterized protein YqhQ
MKFSGISFGGVFGGGTTIFSKHFKLEISKDRKTKEWVHVCKKRKLASTINPMLLIFIPIDFLYYLLEFQKGLLTSIGNSIGSFIASLLRTVKLDNVHVSVPSVSIPLWVLELALVIFLIFYLYFAYWLAFKGVSTWHGCEHKLIAAAENNDLPNVKKYSPINDRCGGTFLFSMYGIMAIYWAFAFYVLKMEIPVGIMTVTMGFAFMEAKYFHKYNIIGLWIGRYLQKKLTVKEPQDWKLELGLQNMYELVRLETEYKHE